MSKREKSSIKSGNLERPGPGGLQSLPSQLTRTIFPVVAVVLLWDTALAWPLRCLVVLFHECGHAAMALVTGGQVAELSISPGEGGHTLTSGGSYFLTLQGGYLGSLAVGVALLRGVRRPGSARGVLFLLGMVLMGAALLWVPLLSFAFAFSVLVGWTFLWLSQRASPGIGQGLLRTLGVFSVLYALVDIRSDVFGAPAGAVTDATLLAHLTGIPSLVWGGLWLTISFTLLWRMRKSLL